MKVHGKDAQLLVNGVPFAYGVSWSASIQRDKVDVSTFADSWKRYTAGLPQVTGSFEGLYNSGSSNPAIQSVTGGNVVQLSFVASNIVVAYGSAWLDMSVQASVNDAVKCSGNFQSTGPWIFI